MINTFSSFKQIRLLIKFLLLLSGNVHLNPGPFYMLSTRVDNFAITSSTSLYGIPLGPIRGSLTITATAGAINLSTPFGTCFTTTHASNSINSIVFPFEFENSLSSWNFSRISVTGSPALNLNLAVYTTTSSNIPDPLNVKVINSSIEPVPTLPQLTSNVPVSIINPSVLPVQIENIDPIEVSLQIGDTLPVSVINPSIFPVQIENSDPIHVTIPTENPLPITGEVSIANPIPSLTTSLFNSFRK